MVMTRKIGFKSLIFQSVSMAMIYGFSGSDLEPVSSNSFDIVDLMIINFSRHHHIFCKIKINRHVYISPCIKQPQYGRNAAKFGVGHQSINQPIH
jgi:hypothetical protein